MIFYVLIKEKPLNNIEIMWIPNYTTPLLCNQSNEDK